MIDISHEEKRRLLAKLLQKREAEQRGKQADMDRRKLATGNDLPLQPIARNGDLELSFGQERVWFLEQLQPETLFYNVLDLYGLSGHLDVELLRVSIETVVNRHDVLRTTYPSIDGRPVQRIGPPGQWTLRVVDLSNHAAGDRQAEARRQIRAEAKTQFDLTTGPLLRTTLYQLKYDEYILALTVHHIAIDGWSVKLLMHELASCYTAAVAGRPSTLPKLTVQYADYAHWQRNWLAGEKYANERDYWVRQIGSQPPTLNLQTDFARPSVRTFAAEVHNSVIPSNVLAKLRDISRREGVTLFTTLLTGFVILLMRYTNQEDFVVGTLIAGRVRPEIERALGFFANTLALRTNLSGNPTFKQALALTRDVVIGAQAHEAFPFEKLVEELKPERGRSSNPLTQVFINMLSFWKQDELAIPGLQFRSLGGLDLHSVADAITLFVTEGSEQVDLCFVYSTELFKLETIERMAVHFLTLLAGIVTNPDERVWALPLLPDAERRSIEKMSAARSPRAPPDVSLYQLFEAQVQARPDAIAVSCDDEHLSYAELDRRANEVGRRLKAMGVGPDAMVGLCAERSLHLVIGLLGILKSGGAYVPIDPKDPQDRISFVLADTRAGVVVTHKAVQAVLPEMPDTTLLLLDDIQVVADHVATNRVSENARSDNIAYVIYTSGSTGQPKGVLVTHGNVVRLLRSTEPWYAFGASDVWPLFHSFAFDVSVWELWGALAYGGRLVVVPYTISRDPQAYLSLLARERVTVLNQTPSAFRLLMEADRVADPPVTTSLRVAIFAGEALELQSLRAWVERHGDSYPRLINMYGITETCVHVTYRPISRDDIESKRASVIGIPIPDLYVSLRDAYGQLVPFGVPGEIYVGGPGVAKGYLNRPELTAERFVSDPLSPDERLYRSGDLARRLPDGDIEYLGRIDQQVKIRGFRIELGEIEATLTENPSVREAVVVVRTIAGENALIAYVVPANSSGALSDDLRLHLRKKLPSYMVPQTIEILPALPLNRNGKIDRRALPAPIKAPTKASSLQLRTTTERRVAAVWEEVLETDGVGPDDNFFDRGGQSMLAVRVASRLREAFGIEVPVSRLFELQTVNELSAWIYSVKSGEHGISPTTNSQSPAPTRISRESVRRAGTSAGEHRGGDH